ncbi:MAG: hypothetical protein QOJ51_391 [Acidobacteriaceae bacterium]|jgi:hypothetical protein|nr:hypothetical protein [Acidobacteriaceae bacterium]
MNDSPNRWRGIAAFTILACTLAGCTNKTTTIPAGQTPPAAAGANPSTAANTAPGNPANAANPAPPNPAQAKPAPQPALVLPRGTRLQVRLNQTIDVKHSASGDRFSGVLAEPIVQGNTVAVPSGSAASGEVLVAHKRGHFKGKSVLALTLTRLEVNGAVYRIDTSNLARTKKGKGKRSAAFIGGGAGMGMLIGGLATGGVGLLVGGLAGGGAGALGAAFTGNGDLSIPAESVVTFRLQDALTLSPETQVSQMNPNP